MGTGGHIIWQDYTMDTLQWEGESKLQHNLKKREYVDQLIVAARDAWQMLEVSPTHVGHTGSLIILDLKGHLQIGSKAQSTSGYPIQVRGFGGQVFSTSSACCSVKGRCKQGVIIEDNVAEPTLDKNGHAVFGLLVDPGQQFLIVSDH